MRSILVQPFIIQVLQLHDRLEYSVEPGARESQMRFLPFHSQEWSTSRQYHVTYYEELGHSWLTQMKDYYATNSQYLTDTFLFKRLGEYTFWTREWDDSSTANNLHNNARLEITTNTVANTTNIEAHATQICVAVARLWLELWL